MILLQLIYSGIALGMIYAVIAFGYQLTFATSGTLNFGQGEALMLGALVGLTLVGLGVNYWVMIPIVCIFGFAQGALVERVGVRPAITASASAICGTRRGLTKDTASIRLAPAASRRAMYSSLSAVETTTDSF